ncbi:hypothetical protein SAMN02800694_2780 [Luteibacter sp. UNCMF331Sha3.1]|uniref:hypothetical protein n=1 Tax=Luteibacter sp. UNCMF331Sha3.1 TaxID=1502760 RepID=UPI0008B66825|nr:hypothetical protein [Luteibacter sp. UNCMF331Sha3.1]SEN10313.1 hypothetical protein SAMN02800694_2780 [Luteibacter sp. UNCMF331Sha3.1]
MPHILDVTGDDIAKLRDEDLRTLVARLALAELGARGLPLSAVTAGGHQDASDGGIDVSVECTVPLVGADFIPRMVTGFQVKRPDMKPVGIKAEMRPKGDLRPSIKALIAQGGAYVMVSAQGSVTKTRLDERRAAIVDAVSDETDAGNLASDFYDRDRLATWANHYPGVASWVRSRSGRGVAGWSAPGMWIGTSVNRDLPFLTDDNTCVVDETNSPPESVPVIEGIARLRKILSQPCECVRLVGLSGLGKTRLVQALFENAIGTSALDPGVTLYTDYGTEPATSARDLAQQLVEEGMRAILVVDNCNAATHAVLTAICRSDGSRLSLLTVEYDVSDDEPEETNVFRLQSASPDIVTEWLARAHPSVSRVNAATIASISDGNFRVAGALAGTVRKGETLGQLRSDDLFDRLFRQRKVDDQSLRMDAEDLALLYSVDTAMDADGGELSHMARLRNGTADGLFASLATLAERGIVQARGRWRAVLPHAIANRLTARALKRIRPEALDGFIAVLPRRMLHSFMHRIGYLHDVDEAQALMKRLMAPGGRFGDLASLDIAGIRLLTMAAPIAPEAVLSRATTTLTLDVLRAMDRIECLGTWVRLIHALAFDASSFDQAATLLARCVIAEGTKARYHEARRTFAALFQIQLSGTHATPDMRRTFVRMLATMPAVAACVPVALDSLLDANGNSSVWHAGFGARPRDWGWLPSTDEDVGAWFQDAIALTVELASDALDAGSLLARHFGTLWRLEPCQDALEAAVDRLSETGVWIEGWIAALRTQYLIRLVQAPADPRLARLIERLAPSDLFDRARGVVLNPNAGNDDDDSELAQGGEPGWGKADAAAFAIGRELALDEASRTAFLPRLVDTDGWTRAYPCGYGLAEGAVDPGAIWTELLDLFRTDIERTKNATVLMGFVRAWQARDASSADAALEDLSTDADVSRFLPALESVDVPGEAGLERLIGLAKQGIVPAGYFLPLRHALRRAPPGRVADLLREIGMLPNGPAVALEVLHGRLYQEKSDQELTDPALVDAGRFLFNRFDFSSMTTMRDYYMELLIAVCLAGTDGAPAAKATCLRLLDGFDTSRLHPHDCTHTLPALFTVQPKVALDVLLLAGTNDQTRRYWLASHPFAEPLSNVPSTTLVDWAGAEPVLRFDALSAHMVLYVEKRAAAQGTLSRTFLDVLEHAPDGRSFLGTVFHRLQPKTCSTTLAALIELRVTELRSLDPPSPSVLRWLDDRADDIARWMDSERTRTREDEQAFE